MKCRCGPPASWKKLGRLSRNEILLLVFVCFALMMWIFAAEWIEPALAALLVIVLMLWTGVLSWNDITSNKAAWNTFARFATLVALAGWPLLHRFYRTAG